MSSAYVLGDHEIVPSPWRCGFCRTGAHGDCERIAHLRDERWTPCSCECQEPIESEAAMAELVEAAQRRRTGTVKSSASRSQSRPCGCGCGDLTKGGTFLPGHDARHRSDLLAVINGEASEGKEQALARMREMHWERFLPEALQAQPLVETAEVNDDNEQEADRNPGTHGTDG